MRIFLIISIVLVGLSSCKSNKKGEVHSSKETMSYTNTTPVEDDCYYPRKTIRTLTNEAGFMKSVAGTFLIVTQDSSRYLPCEIPEEYHSKNMSVIFSGDKLEIFQNERRIGTPLRLSKLRKAK